MSDEGLRAALQARLESLPLMLYMGSDYPTQALPKAELLDLLAAHPPTRICGIACAPQPQKKPGHTRDDT